MKYTNLESISNAIINSNDRLIYLNIIIVFLAIVGVYFSAMFKKAGELKAIEDGFNEIKRQNKIITEDTENIKRQIEKGTIEFQIKLSKYHDKKIEAINLIYKSLANVYNESRKIFLANDENMFNDFYKVVEGFRDTFESNKIWLDRSICDDIENFAIQVDMQVRKYQGALNLSKLPGVQPHHVEKTFDKQQDFYEFTVNESKKLKNELEEMLRVYLSPTSKA